MEIASFEPVIGETYDIQDMTTVLKGIFKGFIQNVRMAEVHGRKITVPSGQPLMLFEIVQPGTWLPMAGGYRYAGVHVSTFYDTYRKRVRFTLAAEHFGNTVDQIARGGPRPRHYWKKVV